MSRGPTRHLFVACYFLSGASALVYEVVWIRLLTLQMGHTVATVSTVLAAFMGGLAIGAWSAGRLSGVLRRPLCVYAALELTVAAIALGLNSALHYSIPLMAWAYADGTMPIRFALVRISVSLLLVAVPTAAMGATFPIAVDWFRSTQSAASAGVLYAANTAGAAMGAIAAGFWLIPAAGMPGTTWIGA